MPDVKALQLIIDAVIKREGGYVDRPNDRGGPTKYGITLKTLSRWRQSRKLAAATIEDVRNLTASEAGAIYYNWYLYDPRIDQLPADARLREFIFDCAVHHGPTTAVKMLQRGVNAYAGAPIQPPLEDDGKLGALTFQAVRQLAPDWLVAHVIYQRTYRFKADVALNPAQAENLDGWLNRVRAFVPASLPKEIYHYV